MSKKTQHSTFNIAKGFNSWIISDNYFLLVSGSKDKSRDRKQFTIDQFSIACVAANNSTFNTQKCKVFAIDRFYYEQCNETEMVAMKTGSDTSGIIMNKWLINEIDIKCRH